MNIALKIELKGQSDEVDICFLLEESHIQMRYMIHNQVLLAPYGWYSYNNSVLRGNVPQMNRSCNQWYVCLFFVGACPTMGEQYCYRVFWTFIVICDTWSSIAPAIHPYPCIGCNTAKGRYILSKSALRRGVWATSIKHTPHQEVIAHWHWRSDSQVAMACRQKCSKCLRRQICLLHWIRLECIRWLTVGPLHSRHESCADKRITPVFFVAVLQYLKTLTSARRTLGGPSLSSSEAGGIDRCTALEAWKDGCLVRTICLHIGQINID